MKYRYDPPMHLKGRDDFKTATSASLECPDHIVNSGSCWFCTECNIVGYAHWEWGYLQMVDFIKGHRNCKVDKQYPMRLMKR